MHRELKNSGLGAHYKIHPITGNTELAPFLGKIVRYRPEILTLEFIERNGLKTVCQQAIFVVREVQLDYRGEERLRVYDISRGDTFGFVEDHNHLEIVREETAEDKAMLQREVERNSERCRVKSKKKITKSRFEARLQEMFSGRLSKAPYTESDREERVNKMTLYYEDNIHVGTWMRGQGWVFSGTL